MASLWRAVFLPVVLMMKAIATPVAMGVCAIVECGGRVVVVRHSYLPGLHLPGGGVDRGEHPAAAIVREMREEIGLVHSAPPQFVGLFIHKVGLVTNHIALYRLAEAEFSFRPGLEIRECRLIDPANPPDGVSGATRRRLTEYCTGLAGPGAW